jgi:hypothetical protein
MNELNRAMRHLRNLNTHDKRIVYNEMIANLKKRNWHEMIVCLYLKHFPDDKESHKYLNGAIYNPLVKGTLPQDNTSHLDRASFF